MLNNTIRLDSAVLSAEFAHQAAQPPTFAVDPKESLQDSIARGFLKPALAGLMRDHIEDAANLHRPHTLGSDRVIGENDRATAVRDALDHATKSIPERFIYDLACLQHSRGSQSTLSAAAEIGALLTVKHSDDARYAIAHELDFAEQKHLAETTQADAALPVDDNNRSLRHARRAQTDQRELLNVELAVNGLTTQEGALAESPLPNDVIARCLFQLASNDISLGALEKAPEQLAQKLYRILSLTHNSQLRAEVHIVLSTLNGADRVEELKTALALGTTPQTRAYAHEHLALLEDGNVVEHLRHALDLTHDQETKARMHYSLRMLNDGDALEHLQKVLNLTQDKEIKADVHLQLARLKDGDVLEHFRKVLDLTQDKEIQASMHYELARLKDGDVLEHLRKILDLTQNKEIQATVHLELARLKDGDVLEHLRKILDLTQDKKLKARIHLGLAKRNDGKVVEHLRQALDLEQDPNFKAEAYFQLARHNDGNIIEHLQNVLALSKDQALKARAHHALARRNVGDVANHLEQAVALTNNPQLKATALKRLRELSNNSGVSQRQPPTQDEREPKRSRQS